jgi:hypothetical protein
MDLKCNIKDARRSICRHNKRGYCRCDDTITIGEDSLGVTCDRFEMADQRVKRTMCPCLYCGASGDTSRLIQYEVIDEEDEVFNKSLSLAFLCDDCGRVTYVDYGFNNDEMEKMQ